MPSGIYKHPSQCGFQKGHKSFITEEKLRNLHKGNKYALGKHWKIEDTSKMSESHKRMKYSKERNEKIRKSKKGDKNPNWKGGITAENKKIWKSIEMKNWRLSVFERDKFLCQMPDCDKTERYLQAHHIKKFSKYPELRFILSNGITLCDKCHNKTKFKEEKFESLFLEILKI
jgi:5-methylcytosine-specific restriction endonuclease McrA